MEIVIRKEKKCRTPKKAGEKCPACGEKYTRLCDGTCGNSVTVSETVTVNDVKTDIIPLTVGETANRETVTDGSGRKFGRTQPTGTIIDQSDDIRMGLGSEEGSYFDESREYPWSAWEEVA